MFSPALDLEKTAFLMIKTAPAYNSPVWAAVIARFLIFPAAGGFVNLRTMLIQFFTGNKGGVEIGAVALKIGL